MDVTSTQAATATATATPVGLTSPVTATQTSTTASGTAPAQPTAPSVSSTPVKANAAVAPVLGSPKSDAANTTPLRQQSGIAPAIAKLFGKGGGAPTPIPLNVSYKVDGDFIVTVFSDPKTGQEITQLPPEILIGLAQFFDQQDGVTLDHNA